MTEPRYKAGQRPARSLTSDVVAEIDKWLLEKDMAVSYSSVCKYISKLKSTEHKSRPSKDVFIRQEYEAFLVNMSGASYRVKETQKMLNDLLK